MKVLLIELDYHPEVVQGICTHLQGSSIELGLVTRRRIYDQIKLDQQPSNLYIIEGNEGISAFFQRNNILDISWDLILFTTAQTNFKALNKLSFGAPVSVIVHNIHAYFNRRKIKLKWNPFFLWKDFSFIVRIILMSSDWYYRRKFLDRVDHFIFPSEFMLKYATENYPTHSNRFAKNTISWVSKQKLEQPIKDFFGITIIGTIDRRRRNYDEIVQLIRKLKLTASKKIKITLAGAPFGNYGNQVIKELEAHSSDHMMVSTYASFVPDDEMIQIVEETDLFIAPIIAETRHHIWTEYYGKTKISGNVNNAIEYWKPTLISNFYPIEESLKDVLTPYRDQDDLNQKVMDFINGKSEFETKEITTKMRTQERIEQILYSLVKSVD